MKKFLTDLWKVIRLPEMLILPGNLAFFLILSLAPILTLFGMISSALSLSTSSITNALQSVVPSGVMEILLPFFEGGLSVTNFVFIIVGFFVASNGPDSLITASNILYKNKPKNYIYLRIKALFMTFWLILLFVFTLIVMAFGSFLGRFGFGFISDAIGRYNALIISLVINAVVMVLLLGHATTFVAFLLAVSVVGACFGGTMSIVPAIVGDAFGSANFGQNYSFVYPGYTVASFIGPMVAASTVETLGTYVPAFTVAGAISIIGIVLVFVAKMLAYKLEDEKAAM